MLPGQGKTKAKNRYITMAALCTLAEIVMAEVVDGQLYPRLRYLAPLTAAFSLLLIFWPMFALRRHGEAADGDSYMAATRVVARGPYAVVRHPQYLGYMSLNVTFMLIAPHWGATLLGALAIVLFYLQARREEAQLLDVFGEAYEAYMRRVPRFNLVIGLARVVLGERRRKS